MVNENCPFCVRVSGEPASVAASIARALELALADRNGTVVFSSERPPPAEGGLPRLVEVVVGDAAAGGPAPDVVVPGDGARAGESAQVVLRHLAAAGYADPLDEYSDDDEAAVSGRLQAFGYL
ncbi:MAG TPA: hypothetical protein VGO87_08920 [Acidimicrobiia bacterium]